MWQDATRRPAARRRADGAGAIAAPEPAERRNPAGGWTLARRRGRRGVAGSRAGSLGQRESGLARQGAQDDGVEAAGAVGERVGDEGGLDDAGLVRGAHLDRVLAGAG